MMHEEVVKEGESIMPYLTSAAACPEWSLECVGRCLSSSSQCVLREAIAEDGETEGQGRVCSGK
jgi:coenzyme F420-reducing hydrogenase gamma subunit